MSLAGKVETFPLGQADRERMLICVCRGSGVGLWWRPARRGIAGRNSSGTMRRAWSSRLVLLPGLGADQREAARSHPWGAAAIRFLTNESAGVPKDGLPSIEHFLYTLIGVWSAPVQISVRLTTTVAFRGRAWRLRGWPANLEHSLDTPYCGSY
jgi:hypothetical protein